MYCMLLGTTDKHTRKGLEEAPLSFLSVRLGRSFNVDSNLSRLFIDPTRAR